MKTIKSMSMRIMLRAAIMFGILGLVLVMTFGMVTAAEVTPDGAYVSDDDMFSYTVTDGQAQITSYNFNEISIPAVVIPSTLTATIREVETTSTVTSFSEKFISEMKYATSIQIDESNEYFSSKDGLLYDKAGTTLIRCPGTLNTAINIPEGVTKIAEYAFQGSNVTSITLPEGLTDIDDFALSNCTELTSLNLPQSLTSIGYRSLFGCRSLENITLPQSLTSIGDDAFCSCSKLTAISIPAGVISIGNTPFSSCNILTTITVDEDNACYSSRDGLLYDKTGTTLIQCPAGLSGEIIIPEGVTKIADNAFNYCYNLTAINLPQGLTSIGNHAFSACFGAQAINLPESLNSIGDGSFYYCNGLTSVTLPQGLTSIGKAPFLACNPLTAITVDENNEYFSIRDGLLYDKAGTILIECLGSPSGEISVPDGVTVIADDAFRSCYDLTAVNLPQSLTNIGDSAFYGCSSLTAITLPEGLTSIGENAFTTCSKLTAVSIPAGVTSIGYGAFTSCNDLKNIMVDENNEYYSSRDGLLYDKAGTILIQCPGGFTGKVNVPEGVLTISNEAFAGCWNFLTSKGLTGITLPQSLKYIGDSAFQVCYGLENFKLIIPENVEYIGHGGLGYQKYSSVTFYSPTTVINNEENSMQLDFRTKIIGWDPSTAKDYYRAMRRGYEYKFEALTPRTVTDVPALSDINVENGTVLENIGLPETVEAILSDDSTMDIELAWDSGNPEYDATKAGTYTFSGTLTNLPVSVINPEDITVTINVTVEQGSSQQTPVYTVTPVADSAYTPGKTVDGINTMTVKDIISGFMYFAVDITPVIPHSGNEATVFTHLRNGAQLSINVTKADFDQVNSAQAGFNVQQNDLVKVYIADDLTNDTNKNPVIFQ